jgi:hypothetical protein
MENANQEHWNNPQPVKERHKKNSGRYMALLLAPLEFINSF